MGIARLRTVFPTSCDAEFMAVKISPRRAFLDLSRCSAVPRQSASCTTKGSPSTAWQVAIDTRNNRHWKMFFESFWVNRKQRRIRKPVFRHNSTKDSTEIGVFDWYTLCQKVLTIRRNNVAENLRQRTTTWKQMCDDTYAERPGSSSSEIRKEVRLRILQLTDRLFADIDGLDEERGARVLKAFADWEKASIAEAIDLHWDGDQFWNFACDEALLTDCLFELTESIDRRFICRSKECTSVRHNHDWLRQISHDYRVSEQHGLYTWPDC